MLAFELSPEQRELKDTARRFAATEMIPVAARHDDEQIFPEGVARKAWELGLMNLEVPRELGGLGLGILDTCLVLEELNYGCAGMTNAIAANGLAATPVIIAGSEEQQKRYLGQLTNEFSFAAFCITEPGAGSDVAGMSTTYRRVGDTFVLNGTKHFISNGTVAHWYVAFATADKKARHAGISAFVFPADLPGIKKHRMKNKLGQRAADTGEVVFEDVEVPKSALLGQEGEGFKVACGPSTAAAPRSARSPSACRSARSTSRCATRRSGSSSGSRSRSFRRSSSCSPTWRSRSRPCGSSPTRRPG
jgi:acyl-CoA dehydrogenase